MRQLCWMGCVAFALGVMFWNPAGAQFPVAPAESDRVQGISVSGTGEVRAKPNLVEIDLRAAGVAELSGDAVVKYRDTKRRMTQALEALKLENLKIAERGITVTSAVDASTLQQALMRGQTVTEKPQMQVARTMRVSLENTQDVPEETLMETLGKIFDVAKDAGIAIAPSPEAAEIARRYGRESTGASASFVLDNLVELREQAYQKAVEDARARAQRLAKLTGLKLGPVTWVQELQVSGDDPVAQAQAIYYGYPAMSTETGPVGPRVTSPTFGEIAIRVKLSVRFGVSKPETEAARK